MKKLILGLLIAVPLLVIASVSTYLSLDSESAHGAANEQAYKIPRIENLVEVVHSGKSFFITGGDGLVVELDSLDRFSERNVKTLQDFRSISFADGSNGWVVGTKGVMFKTSDGGQSWKAVDRGTGKIGTSNLMTIDSDSGNRVVVAGEAGAVALSEDRGKTFADVSIPEDINISHVKLTKTGIYAGGEFGSLYAYNKGAWKKVAVNKFSGESWMNPELISGMVDIDDGKVGLVGFTGDVYVYDARNGNVKVTSSLNVPLYSVSRSRDYFVACGEYGKLFYSKDFADWKEASKDANINVFLRSIAFDRDKSNTGVTVGGYGTVLITKDGGVNWKKIN